MDKIDVEAVRELLAERCNPLCNPDRRKALALIDQLTAERDALQAKVDAMQAAHQKFRQEVSDVVVNVLHHQEIGVPYFPGVLRNALTKFLVKTDPVEKAITSWLYESGYEGNAEVEQALRQFLVRAPEAAAVIEADREAVRAEQAAEIERLREALTTISHEGGQAEARFARAALAGDSNDQ